MWKACLFTLTQVCVLRLGIIKQVFQTNFEAIWSLRLQKEENYIQLYLDFSNLLIFIQE